MDFFFKQRRTDTSGTVTVDESTADIWIIHDAEEVVSNLTIPFVVEPIDRQVFGISSVKGINTLTLSSGVEICSPVTFLPEGGRCAWMYCGDSEKWIRFI